MRRDLIIAEIPRLRRFARALARERDLADDLVQECLERALNRLSQWRGEDKTPRAWLLRILYSRFIDHQRRMKRTPVPIEPEAVAALGGGDLPDAPARLDLDDALRAMQALPEERRVVLALVAIEGLSYAEVANVLELPVGTVMSRLARGREQLRAILEQAPRRDANLRVIRP